MATRAAPPLRKRIYFAPAPITLLHTLGLFDVLSRLTRMSLPLYPLSLGTRTPSPPHHLTIPLVMLCIVA